MEFSAGRGTGGTSRLLSAEMIRHACFQKDHTILGGLLKDILWDYGIQCLKMSENNKEPQNS